MVYTKYLINHLLTLLFVFVVQILFAQNNNGFLRRQNTQFINNDGVVLLKGVNLGNWLHIEPYMINAPTNIAGSYQSLFSAITQVTGSTAHSEAFFNTWYTTFIQKKDIDSIAAMGFNHVRIPFPYHMFYNETNNTFISNGFVYLDNVVNWCKQNNIYAILDLHHAMGGQINTGIWENYATSKPILKQLWKNIAQHYANETAVGGYDILNEPVISNQLDQWMLKDLYIEISTEIRTVDQNHILFFEGNWYASSFWELTDGTPSANDRWDENMALSQHVYWVPQPSSTNQWVNTIATAMNVPVWCGEAGENSNHWLNDCVRDCENNNSGWCLWTYKKAGGISALYSNPYNSNYQAVLNFWNGSTQPTQSLAISGLQQFATQSDLDFCTYKKDVTDALLRTNFHIAAQPFNEHTLPSTIQAVEYDMGANGIAYNDAVFQSTGQGNNFTNYNNGWTYRNDGVDIETWTGSPTIGSINTNEWLNYTLNVPLSGMYKIFLQYASPSQTSKVEFQSDGNIIIPQTTLNTTNDWGTFIWQELGIVPILSQSDYKCKLIIKEEGMNIKAIKFEYTGVLSVTNSKFEKPILFFSDNKLKINSNQSIHIVEVYDISGKLIVNENYNIPVIACDIPFYHSKGTFIVRLHFTDNQKFSTKIAHY